MQGKRKLLIKKNNNIEEEKNKKELIEKTIQCSKDVLCVPLEDIKNKLFYEINNQIKEIFKEILKNEINTIINIFNQKKIN